MNAVQKFDTFVMGLAPLWEVCNVQISYLREQYAKFDGEFKKIGQIVAEKVKIAEAEHFVVTALKVAPLSLALFVLFPSTFSAYSILVSAGLAGAFYTQPDLLSEEGKKRIVVAAISVTTAQVAFKVVSSLVTFNLETAFLTFATGLFTETVLYSVYKWLGTKAEATKVEIPAEATETAKDTPSNLYPKVDQ